MKAKDVGPVQSTFLVMVAFMSPMLLFTDCKGAGSVPTILENVPGALVCELIPLPQNMGVICSDLIDLAQNAIASADDAGAFAKLDRAPCKLVPLSRKGGVYYAGSVCEEIAVPIQKEIDK